MSRTRPVRSMTLAPSSFSRLRAWLGESSSSKTNRSMPSSSRREASSVTLPEPRNVFGFGERSRCTVWPTTRAPAVTASWRSSSSESSIGQSPFGPGLSIPTRWAFSTPRTVGQSPSSCRIVGSLINDPTGFSRGPLAVDTSLRLRHRPVALEAERGRSGHQDVGLAIPLDVERAAGQIDPHAVADQPVQPRHGRDRAGAGAAGQRDAGAALPDPNVELAAPARLHDL